MSEYTRAEQLERFEPVSVPGFDGVIEARDLRPVGIAWLPGEQDGLTPEAIDDYEKARMTLNALTVLTRMSEHDGLRRLLSSKQGRDEYRQKHPGDHRDIEQIIRDDRVEFKFWHRESIGSVRLLKQGSNPGWVDERQRTQRHRFEGLYADHKNAERRTKRIRELSAFLLETAAVDQSS